MIFIEYNFLVDIKDVCSKYSEKLIIHIKILEIRCLAFRYIILVTNFLKKLILD